mgnify:CR=1 FL=1
MFGYGDEDKPEIDWETVKQVKENTQNHFKEIRKNNVIRYFNGKVCFVFASSGYLPEWTFPSKNVDSLYSRNLLPQKQSSTPKSVKKLRQKSVSNFFS